MSYFFAGSGGDVTAPTVVSRTIPAGGDTLVRVYNEACRVGAGGNAGFTLAATGGAVTESYASGDGTSTHTYNLSRTVNAGETVTETYVQPGDGIEDTSSNHNDLASYSTQSVTNSSGAGATAPTPDLLWWKLNDGSGNTIAADVGPNGTTNGDWITGKSGSGSALRFIAGNVDRAQTSGTIAFGATVTICAWAWRDATDFSVIFESSENFGAGGSNDFIIYQNNVPSDRMTFGIGATVNNRIESVASPSTGAWFHLAVVMDLSVSGGAIKAYFDAVLQSTTLDANLIVGSGTFTTDVLNVAARDSTNFNCSCRMDDIRIYGRELTSTEIALVRADPQ